MPRATLSTKGRITLPHAVRQALGLHAGTRIDFVALADGFKIVPLKKEQALLKGRFVGRNHPVSVEAMDGAACLQGTSGRAASKKLLA